MKTREELNSLSRMIVDAAMSVHKEMGPGLLESVYHHCLLRELQVRQVAARTTVQVPLNYKGNSLGKEYIIDVLVEDEIILELKSVEGLLPIHDAQLISYLRLADKRLGFLINFNVRLLKDGLKRFVNNF